MPNKRTNTATWIESRSHWRISVQKDGVRRDFYSSKAGKAGQREANAKADRWLKDDVFDDRIKVKQVYDLFLQQEHGRGSSANYEAVESIGRNWILPNIGNKRISAIKLGDYQAIIIKAEKAGRSRKTLSNIRGIISRFAKFCRQNGYSELYTADLEISKHAPMKIKKILQPEDLRILFTSDETILNRKPAYDIYINAYRLQVVTGLRPGELIGLKWPDITPHEICVKRSINVRGETTQGKNDNAIRTIPITPLIQEYWRTKKTSTIQATFSRLILSIPIITAGKDTVCIMGYQSCPCMSCGIHLSALLKSFQKVSSRQLLGTANLWILLASMATS